ncbi:MAG: ribonuclease E activity regulator RraA [Candidatus Korobacteraceae bacterium]|jgi:regulator of ribonuclease activity A
MTLKTTDLCDQFEQRARVLAPIFHDFGGRAAFDGVAVTVKCFEDNSRIKELSLTPGAGKVLVVDAGGSSRCAVVGDVIAGDFVKNGWAGIVLFGYVRDKAALAALPLGVKALGTNPRRSNKRSEGQANIPVEIGGHVCHPGDHIYADEDGVIILNENVAAK